MGNRGGKPKMEEQQLGLDKFSEALRVQLANPDRVVRAFDVGGSGVKTAKLSAASLQEFLHPSCSDAAVEDTRSEERQLQWTEPPMTLGQAPGERGFSSWLLKTLPDLRAELADANVCFGVSVGGDLDHATGTLKNWWPGGGHPRQWAFGHPVVADIMGLPQDRTFVLHDGEAHLLGCSRGLVPPPSLGCLALGTGVGFGLSDSIGAVVDPSSKHGVRSHLLNGVPLSGARYRGVWQTWLERPTGSQKEIDEVINKPFANIVENPFRMPWVSLVLGRRGMELAEAVHGCPHLRPDASSSDAAAPERGPAVRAYGEQWLHFLHTQFIPQLAMRRVHPVTSICFAGGVMEFNWPVLREVLVEPASQRLRPLPASLRRGGLCCGSEVPELTVLPLAPKGSGLIGAGIYALAGMGGGAQSIWACV